MASPLQSPSLLQRFEGALLGGAIADALGGRFEARPADSIRSQYPTPLALVENTTGELWYTDDTQMTLGVAECLIECGRIDEPTLCRRFVANYVPSRGYGRGTRVIIEAMEDQGDYQAVATSYFPDGSFGNGAAMRVAPVGLFFHDHPERLLEAARLSALPTHSHPLAIDSARLQALAVALALQASPAEPFDRAAFFAPLLAACQTPEFRERLQAAAQMESPDQLAALGNGIQAIESVPTAIAAFALHPRSYVETIGAAILLGGDTDTIAGMAGAISGAHLGMQAIPPALLARLENSPQGRTYLHQLAQKLADARPAAPLAPPP